MKLLVVFIILSLLAGVIGLIFGYRIALVEAKSYGASNIQWMFSEAAGRGDVRTLQRLYESGAQINEEPISHAPNFRYTGLLLDTLGSIAVDRPRWARETSGFPALVVAASGGHAEAVQWLLDHDADVNGSPNTTPLQSANYRLQQTEKTIEILIEHGGK